MRTMMIDTDKYETDNGSIRIGLLRQDAELLLQEVKRLREYQDKLHHALDLCASKEIERWIDEEEARIWSEEE